MKILAVTTKSPYPLHEGRALRTFNLLKQTAQWHEIVLLTFVQTPEEVAGVDRMREFCSEVHVIPLYLGRGKWRIPFDMVRELFCRTPLLAIKYRSHAMRKKLRAALAKGDIDVVHLDMLHLGEYRNATADVPVVLVEHNVESVLMRRRAENTANWLAKAYLYYQYWKLKNYEARASREVSRVVAVSDVDANILREMTKDAARVVSIPNGVDTGYFAAMPVPRDPNMLVFVGGFGWFPNLDGIRYFVDDILPLVARECPNVTLTVVGKNPDTPAVEALAAHPRVRLTGLIDDVRPTISAAAAFVVPLRIGGGTRLKILDALSMGRAVISTSVGCEGLDVTSGEQLLIADTPEEFARAVVLVLRDPALGMRLGAAGRQRVAQRYEWSVIAQQMLRVYEDCVGAR